MTSRAVKMTRDNKKNYSHFKNLDISNGLA